MRICCDWFYIYTFLFHIALWQTARSEHSMRALFTFILCRIDLRDYWRGKSDKQKTNYSAKDATIPKFVFLFCLSCRWYSGTSTPSKNYAWREQPFLYKFSRKFIFADFPNLVFVWTYFAFWPQIENFPIWMHGSNSIGLKFSPFLKNNNSSSKM